MERLLQYFGETSWLADAHAGVLSDDDPLPKLAHGCVDLQQLLKYPKSALKVFPYTMFGITYEEVEEWWHEEQWKEHKKRTVTRAIFDLVIPPSKVRPTLF
eukprot:Hpha_TRINITY_DN24973_c0_g1::TRINITY_DN24973_c0_g1_i1::g.111137::m.111137